MFNSSDKRPAWHNWRFLFRDLGCDKMCLGRATDTQGSGDHGKTPSANSGKWPRKRPGEHPAAARLFLLGRGQTASGGDSRPTLSQGSAVAPWPTVLIYL